MSILVEIADTADVTVEDVLRVLAREPVARAARERILVALDELGGEQTRVLERFALAAVHDAAATNGERGAELARTREGDDGPPPRVASADALRHEELTAQVGRLLEELVVAVQEIRREGQADRQERVDDLALLVDLLSTGWKRVDRRLGRVERLVERLEAARPIPGVPPWSEPLRIEPVRTYPLPVEAPPAPKPEPKRSWLPLTGILVLLLAALLAILAFDLLPGSDDPPRLLTDSESASPPPTATAPAPTASAPGPTVTTAPPSTVPTTSTAPQQPAQRPPTTTSTSAPPPTRTARPSGPAFQPARDFVWTPVAGATYYSVRFFHEDKLFYGALPARPRLTVPKRLVFEPGSYRWVVRPGLGPRTAKRLGPAVVDSVFVVAR